VEKMAFVKAPTLTSSAKEFRKGVEEIKECMKRRTRKGKGEVPLQSKFSEAGGGMGEGRCYEAGGKLRREFGNSVSREDGERHSRLRRRACKARILRENWRFSSNQKKGAYKG